MVPRVAAVLLVILPALAVAHPGGGMIAIDANTVIFGDPVNNVLWRMSKGRKPEALFTKLHVHWTTRGVDGHIYAESFGEMGGALFQVDMVGGKHVRFAEEPDLNAPVFAVGKNGELVFEKQGQIVQRTRDGNVTAFRGNGRIAKGDSALGQVIAYQWAPDGTLYLSDGGNLRRIGTDGVVRLVAKIDGKLLDRQIWNSTGSSRIWSIAIDDRKRIFAALADNAGQVVRIDPGGEQHIVDQYMDGWRVTAVAAFADTVFMLEISDRSNVGQRVRVIRGDGKVEIMGQVDS